jgi:hypothetical integral membrane protein (TIGR02206 family)
MTVSVSPLAYTLSTLMAIAVATVVCIAARRRPGQWTVGASGLLGAALLGEQISWQVGFLIHHDWTLQNSLPFDLCDFTALVATVACWWCIPICVELTYFWGFAGTLQAIITPDVETPFPHLEFINYVVEHLGIVVAAVFLVVGLRVIPRPGAVLRVFGLTVAYALLVAVVDIVTGADYLFLRAPPEAFSLLQVLGPWPWYLVSCTGIALVAFYLLDLPFQPGRRRRREADEALRSPTAG